MAGTNKLTDTGIKKLTATGSAYKRFDGGGLMLYVTPTGSKLWRLTYRNEDGKAQTQSFGAYPQISLVEARQLRDKFKDALKKGEVQTNKDQSKQDVKKDVKSYTVTDVIEAYWETKRGDLTLKYIERGLTAFYSHLAPHFGDCDIRQLTKQQVVAALNIMSEKGLAEYLRKSLSQLKNAIDWAIEHDLAEMNVCSSIKPDKAFRKRVIVNFPAVSLNQVHEVLDDLDQQNQLLVSVQALKVLILTTTRTQELRLMQREQLDFENAVWTIPADVMKMGKEHRVPLIPSVVRILKRMLKHYPTSVYVFPGGMGKGANLEKSLSENVFLALLDEMGWKGKQTGHGFRSIWNTWAAENDIPYELSEIQLAHTTGKLRSTYQRSDLLEKRRAALLKYEAWLWPKKAAIPELE